MFSRLFNNKRKEKEKQSEHVIPNANFSFLGADMHSHFIPGIDDGAKTIEESLSLIEEMITMGYNTIITTPHIMIDYYANTPSIIQNGLAILRQAAEEKNLTITIKAAAEYYIDEYFTALLDKEPLLTLYQKEVLVECSMLYEPPMLADVLFNMASSGYRPVMAHPERYVFLHNNMDKYREFKDRGCLLQLNMLSVTGYYGKNIRLAAEQLLAEGLYDYIGTDIHHEKHTEAIKNLLSSKAYPLLSGYPFLNSRLCL